MTNVRPFRRVGERAGTGSGAGRRSQSPNPVAKTGIGANIFVATSAYVDASNTYDPGGRLGQVMIRFNW